MPASAVAPTRTADPHAPRRRVTSSAALVVLAVLPGLAVLGLADSVGEHDGPSVVDPHVAADVLAHRSGALTALAHVLSLVGSEGAAAVVALAVLVVLVVRRDLFRAAVLSVAMVGSAALTVGVKLLVARPRPGAVDRLGPVDSSYSFPSGHVLNSAVVLAVILWLLWPSASRGARAGAAAGFAVLVLGIAASRVYLGYHWLTDVTASGLVAIAWLSAVALLLPVVRRTTEHLSTRVPALAGPGERVRRPQR